MFRRVLLSAAFAASLGCQGSHHAVVTADDFFTIRVAEHEAAGRRTLDASVTISSRADERRETVSDRCALVRRAAAAPRTWSGTVTLRSASFAGADLTLTPTATLSAPFVLDPFPGFGAVDTVSARVDSVELGSITVAVRTPRRLRLTLPAGGPVDLDPARDLALSWAPESGIGEAQAILGADTAGGGEVAGFCNFDANAGSAALPAAIVRAVFEEAIGGAALDLYALTDVATLRRDWQVTLLVGSQGGSVPARTRAGLGPDADAGSDAGGDGGRVLAKPGVSGQSFHF